VSSRTARATQRNLVSKNQKKKKKNLEAIAINTRTIKRKGSLDMEKNTCKKDNHFNNCPGGHAYESEAIPN
jgi:hypothetical protein